MSEEMTTGQKVGAVIMAIVLIFAGIIGILYGLWQLGII